MHPRTAAGTHAPPKPVPLGPCPSLVGGQRDLPSPPGHCSTTLGEQAHPPVAAGSHAPRKPTTPGTCPNLVGGQRDLPSTAPAAPQAELTGRLQFKDSQSTTADREFPTPQQYGFLGAVQNAAAILQTSWWPRLHRPQDTGRANRPPLQQRASTSRPAPLLSMLLFFFSMPAVLADHTIRTISPISVVTTACSMGGGTTHSLSFWSLSMGHAHCLYGCFKQSTTGLLCILLLLLAMISLCWLSSARLRYNKKVPSSGSTPYHPRLTTLHQAGSHTSPEPRGS